MTLYYTLVCTYNHTYPARQAARNDRYANVGQSGLPAPGSRDGAVYAARHPAALQPPPKNLHVCHCKWK